MCINDLPVISVIIPVYNVEKYIRRCLNSIVAQEINGFECIVVDDGSNDGSSIICDEYAEKFSFIKVIHQKNGGVSVARNVGMAHSKGKYIVFVDADDFVETDMLSSYCQYIEDYNEPDIIICGYKEVFKNNINVINYTDIDIDSIKRNYLTETWGPSLCNKCFRKTLFSNEWFPEGQLYEDYWLLPKVVFKAQSIKIIDKAFYNYDRTVENSITHKLDSRHRFFKWKAKFINEIFALNNCLDVYKKCEKNTIGEARRCMFKHYFDGMLNDSQVEEVKVYLKAKELDGKDKFWANRILKDDIWICKVYSMVKGYS